MCVSYLGFVFLIWFPGVLHAQSAAEPCSAPVLKEGYLVPQQDTYPDKTEVTYACNNGFKPAVEGWWATITCQNGRWSQEPQCIDENSCLPPTITNGKYTENNKEQTINITCDEGYKVKNGRITATCTDQIWSSLPVCEKRNDACLEPPQIPHGVILQRHKEVFAANSRVRYGCETGYIPSGRNTNTNTKTITCSSGQWNEEPKCHTFCVIDPDLFEGHNFVLRAKEYIMDGQKKSFPCIWEGYTAFFMCTDRRLSVTRCCSAQENCSELIYQSKMDEPLSPPRSPAID